MKSEKRVGTVSKNKLQDFRKRKSLTQEELAKAVGVAPKYISMLERGERTPGFALAKKIADFLGATVDEIFFDGESEVS